MSEVICPEDKGHDDTVPDINHSARDYPRGATLHQLISEQATRCPEACAVVYEDKGLSYGDLERRSNQLAHHLRALGVRPDQPVAICIERSLEMLVGLLGILKAGGAYIPLDPSYPTERIAYMIEDSQIAIILTQESLLEALPAGGARVLCLDRDWLTIAAETEVAPSPAAGPEDLAYVIYTSGSTGRPKGVEISHRALVNFLWSLREEPGLTASDRLLAVTTLSFDIAGLELYLPLIVGAQVVLASRTMAADGNQLAQAIEGQGITVMQATPATWRLLLEAGWEGNPKLRILCGGETFPRDLAERLLPRCSQLWNLYGPTETTIWSTLQRVESGKGAVPIGRPIANTEIWLLDKAMTPVPPGTPGELFIGGDGLARGYFKRPGLTAERFLPHPFDKPCAVPAGRRLYRTGDLAKQRPDGSLEHLGRVDFQVKVRGFRIELGEIETALEQQVAIRQAVVLAREDRPGDKRLVAYLVAAQEPPPSSRALREALSRSLPDYMIPGFYIFLEALPLTPNGKVDRQALQAPGRQRPELAEDYEAPRTENETLLTGIWAEVLRVDEVGIRDNFFELGGDSLKVAQVASRIRESFHVDMPPGTLFEMPTVAKLTAVIKALPARAKGLEELPIVEVKRGPAIPLSFAQERVWFIHQLDSNNLAYNFQSTIHFQGSLDVAALERTLGEILQRHEIYRTTFPMIDGRPQQIVHPAQAFTLPIVNLSDRPEEQRAQAAQDWYDKEFQRRFELTKLPLVRWTLLRFSAEEQVLVHMEHHLVHDGWSFNLFLRELVDLYKAFAAGKPSPLPELPVQFAEFTTWQHQWMQGAVSDHQLTYWKQKFATIPPVLDLPTKGPRPATQSFRGTSLRPEIPLDLCNALRALSRKEGSTLFMTMLAGFIALLHRYTGEPDIAVGTFFANRRAREAESLIGMILNNVVIRASLEADPTVREFMAQVRDVVLEGANFQDVPFDRVVKAVQPKRDMSYNPLFQIMFSFHDEPMPEEGLPGLDVKLTPVISNGSAKFDLGVIGIPHSAQYLGLPQGSDQDGMTMIWEHNTDLFDTSTIARMIEHYIEILEAVVAHPDLPLSRLPILSGSEREKILGEWNATDADYPADACLPDLVHAQASESPDAVAVVFGDTEMTYRELDARANRLAHHLRGLGVSPDTLVGICVDRSSEMVVGLLGILKAGGAYVPIDPAFPADRQAFMIEDAGISLLVTERDLCDELPLDGIRVLRLDADQQAIASESDGPVVDNGVTPENLAYVIYTSGSTGRPKGVQIPHRALVNFLTTMRARPGLSPDDRLFAVTTLSFDIAGLELFLPLAVGARVIIGSRSVVTDGKALAAELEATGTTVMQATPATWRMLLEAGWQGDESLKVLCGGEALTRDLADRLLGCCGELWNMFGPTETTIWSTVHRVEPGPGTVPVGRPIGNTQVYVLDSHLEPVPIGVSGEIYIGGAGVAKGYWNRPELTEERFVADPFGDAEGARLYRTGDLGRYLPNGELEVQGRLDHQVKLRGFRIELGEIEVALCSHPEVREAVVVLRGAGADQSLVAYVVPQGETTPEAGELRAILKGSLPDYMVPARYVTLDALPLTPNGKVDRNALPEIERVRLDLGTTFVAPETPTQRNLAKIWAEVLDLERVGIHDDFFDLGGHSLLAVRLVSKIEAKMGQSIPLVELFQGRTIEHIARIVDEEHSGKSSLAIVAIQPNGSNPPVFAGGSHPKYVDVARRLGRNQPFYRLDVYGLQSERLAEGQKIYSRNEDMAARFIEELRAVQPVGPYFLGGGCEGGIVAFEMALQLQRQGEQIACLVIWGVKAPGHFDGRYGRLNLFINALNHLHSLLRGGVNLRELLVLIKHEYVEYRIFRAVDLYLPSERYRGKLTIVRTVEHAPSDSEDLSMGWAVLGTEGAEVQIMPGTHQAMFDTYADEFGDLLESCLAAARRG